MRERCSHPLRMASAKSQSRSVNCVDTLRLGEVFAMAQTEAAVVTHEADEPRCVDAGSSLPTTCVWLVRPVIGESTGTAC